MTAPLGGHTRDPEQLPKVKGPDDEDMHVFAQAGKIKKNHRLVSRRLHSKADVV